MKTVTIMTKRIPTLLLALMVALAAALPLSAAVPRQEQKLERGGRVIIRGTMGDISITGWDRDTVEAQVHGEDGDEESSARITRDSSGALVISPGSGSLRSGDTTVAVRLPRYADIQLAHTSNGGITVTGMEGNMNLNSGNGDIQVTGGGTVSVQAGSGDVRVESTSGPVKIGSGSGDISVSRTPALDAMTGSGDLTLGEINGPATARTGSGDIKAYNIRGDLTASSMSGDFNAGGIGGMVNLSLTSGDAVLTDIGGDIHVSAISGGVTVKCARGRVEVNSVSGTVAMSGVSGDVDASSTSGDIHYTGPVRESGRYRLKSMNGIVEMNIPADTPGFTVTLSSYAGSVKSDFDLKLDSPLQSGAVNRRVIGRWGNGQAQITLDSFKGEAKINKSATAPKADCPQQH